MITAAEARQNVKAFKEEKERKDTQRVIVILDEISKLSKKGERKLELNKSVSDIITYELQERGFEVIVHNGNNLTDGWLESHTTISW